MERLTIDEVIEHCNKTCEQFERVSVARNQEIKNKTYSEHYCVAEWLEELKGFRDIGLTPTQLLEVDKLYAEKCMEVVKLKAEFEQVIKIPCKVGDVVYEIFRGRIQEYTIISIHLSNCSHLYGWRIKTENGVYSNVNGFEESAIGSRIFLTREEAKQALKGEVSE